jgi:hypothetical protein
MGGGGALGAGCMGTPASYESLPAPSGHTDSHTLDTYIWGVGALILDRCRVFDLFASVDAHLCLEQWSTPYGTHIYKYLHYIMLGGLVYCKEAQCMNVQFR